LYLVLVAHNCVVAEDSTGWARPAAPPGEPSSLPEPYFVSSEQATATLEEVAQAIQEIRAYRDQGRQSLRELPERGKHGARAIDEQAEQLGWNPTKFRQAGQEI
jgi:hypothetical protein